MEDNNSSGGGGSSTNPFDAPTSTTIAESPHLIESPTAHGEQHATGNSASSQPGLNPRSCIICRRRKVRCNKTYPCSNCAKAKVQCVFPAPERAKRRPRKPPDGELMSRLRRLEGVIQNMGKDVEEELAVTGSQPGKAPGQVPLPDSSLDLGMGVSKFAASSHFKRKTNGYDRLIVNDGKSRYMNNQFWATFTSELEDLKGILDESSEEDDDYPSPATDFSSPPVDSSFLYQYSSMSNDLSTLHPPAEHIWMLWEIYKEYNDPVVKVVHTPTMEKQVQASLHNPSKSSKPMEAFLFAIYFAAVTALAPEIVYTKFGETRDTLVKRYKFGVEQALARANFLISEEVLVLMCYLTYLACLRCHEDGRLLWSLNGMAVRMAISMGLHRDGSNFPGVSPYETELRRRVWWQLIALEWRGSQDSGIEPSIMQCGYDTQLPLNINDTDLDPAMREPPQPRKGLTDLTFCVLRYDLQKSLYKLFEPNATLQDKERVIKETHQHLENDYFAYCDMSKPLDWTICTLAKLIMARQFLILYHPHLKTLPQHTIDRLFVTSLESIEFALRLETEIKTVKWGWLFKTYNQWHALAFLLSELTRRTKGPLVQRAWRAVNSTVAEVQSQYSDARRGQLWKPVLKLVQTARAARERELLLEAQNMRLDQSKLAANPMAGPRHNLAPAQTIKTMQPMDAMLAREGFGMNGGGMTNNNNNGAGSNGFGHDMSMGMTAGMANLMMDNMSGMNSGNVNQQMNGGVGGGDGGRMDTDLRMAMGHEPDLSMRSNPIDDQYQFDNTSNSVPMTSEFFGTLGMWQGGKMAPDAPAGDWFNTWATENNMMTMSDFDSNLLNSFNGLDQNWNDPLLNADASNGAAGGGGAGGSGVAGRGGQQFMGTDWDEVMKEFAPNDGIPAMGTTQWGKPGHTLLNEKWI